MFIPLITKSTTSASVLHLVENLIVTVVKKTSKSLVLRLNELEENGRELWLHKRLMQ
jgi:hypothetical protein